MRAHGFVLAASLLLSTTAYAEIAGPSVKIGVMTDLSGVFEAGTGAGSVEATKIAVEEFGSRVNGKPIEVLAGDHQNKPDVGAALANRWYDVDKVDMITDLVNSAVAFAVLDISKQKNKTLMITSAGSDDFTGKACAPDNSVHWAYDSFQLGQSIGGAATALGKTWFYLSADYAFGNAMEASVTPALTKFGAKVVGGVKHPLGATDFSSYILQAQASGAEVVAFNSGGDDSVNALKAAREFGLKAKIVGFGLDTPTSIKAMGLGVAGGAYYVTPWVERQDAADHKAFVEKFIARRKVYPGSFQTATYSAVRSWLKAVEATNSVDPKTVIAKMRETKVNDVFTTDGVLRPDGRMVHSVAVMQIKQPSESKGEWDQTKVISTIKGDDVFRPLSANACPLVK